MNVYTLSGKTIALKEPALASGGEGKVYEIIGYPAKVAKIYHDLSNAKAKERKITEMVKTSEDDDFQKTRLTQDVAWPLSPLFDAKHNFVGFGMNRIVANNELDDLYVYPPKNNINVTIENKIDCAISLCGIVERLHSQGQYFGDGNPVNLKIDKNFNVCFLDADSFQFNSSGNVYRCEVCASGYVAPELIKKCKGTTYADCPGETFNKETDNFSLAIHIFRLLFNGAHPYICQRQLTRAGSAPAPKSTDKRVESGETPFFRTVPNHTTPSYAPDINSIPPYVRSLFERAFVDGHTNPNKRPSATEWKQVLNKFKGEIRRCSKNHVHYYWNGNKSCPYCEADKRYATKMNSSALATSYPGNASKAIIPTKTTTFSPPIAASSHNKSRNISSGSSSFAFWIITIFISVVLIALLGNFALPELYYSITGDSTLTTIGVVGSCIAGFVGTFIYNGCWALGKYAGGYSWYEYVLSILTTLGFVIGFGILMGIVAIVLTILVYALGICFIIGIIAAIFSGG